MPPSTSVTAFYGEVGSVRYRAAIVRQAGPHVYFWTWQDRPGTIIRFDLIDGTRRILPEILETHKSLHADGVAHTRVVMRRGSKRTTKDTLGRPEKWRNFALTVPLDSVPAETLHYGPWNEVTREIVLRSADFGDAAGVDLAFDLADASTISALKRQFRHHWVLSGDRTLVVGAIPILPETNRKKGSASAR
jgi:hypothetical protein